MAHLPKTKPLDGGMAISLDNSSVALDRLVRTIALSRGQFSLILARCDSSARQRKLASQVAERTGMDIWQLSLPPSATTLLSAIEQALSQPPEALMVMGLESVRSLDPFLRATNLARNEFGQKFSFPLVLWVNESILQKLRRTAPDFRSWAGNPIQFDTGEELPAKRSTDSWREPAIRFERFEPPSRGGIRFPQTPASTSPSSLERDLSPIRGSSEVCALEPSSLEEMEQVIQALRDRKAVILKMTRIDPDEGQRALDFLVGGSYAIDGDWLKIAEAIFLFVPSCIRLHWYVEGKSQL
ncbi:MAG: cell division protein SepF [Cyanobacteriota bacterium]|nr:cell division protein SepF [Cyanobacteriota bacterium]